MVWFWLFLHVFLTPPVACDMGSDPFAPPAYCPADPAKFAEAQQAAAASASEIECTFPLPPEVASDSGKDSKNKKKSPPKTGEATRDPYPLVKSANLDYLTSFIRKNGKMTRVSGRYVWEYNDLPIASIGFSKTLIDHLHMDQLAKIEQLQMGLEVNADVFGALQEGWQYRPDNDAEKPQLIAEGGYLQSLVTLKNPGGGTIVHTQNDPYLVLRMRFDRMPGAGKIRRETNYGLRLQRKLSFPGAPDNLILNPSNAFATRTYRFTIIAAPPEKNFLYFNQKDFLGELTLGTCVQSTQSYLPIQINQKGFSKNASNVISTLGEDLSRVNTSLSATLKLSSGINVGWDAVRVAAYLKVNYGTEPYFGNKRSTALQDPTLGLYGGGTITYQFGGAKRPYFYRRDAKGNMIKIYRGTGDGGIQTIIRPK